MLLFGAGARTPNNSCPVDMPSDGFRPRDVSLTGGLKGSFKGTGTASRPSKEPFSVSGPGEPTLQVREPTVWVREPTVQVREPTLRVRPPGSSPGSRPARS